MTLLKLFRMCSVFELASGRNVERAKWHRPTLPRVGLGGIGDMQRKLVASAKRWKG